MAGPSFLLVICIFLLLDMKEGICFSSSFHSQSALRLPGFHRSIPDSTNFIGAFRIIQFQRNWMRKPRLNYVATNQFYFRRSVGPVRMGSEMSVSRSVTRDAEFDNPVLTYFDDLIIRAAVNESDMKLVHQFIRSAGPTNCMELTVKTQEPNGQFSEYLLAERNGSCLALGGFQLAESTATLCNIIADTVLPAPDDMIIFLLSCLESRARLRGANSVITHDTFHDDASSPASAEQPAASIRTPSRAILSRAGYAPAGVSSSPPPVYRGASGTSPPSRAELRKRLDGPGAGEGRGGAKGAEELIEAVGEASCVRENVCVREKE
jgi:hypothetical protein